VLTGSSLPGNVVYPDFFNSKAVSWWTDKLSDLFGQVAFDFVWENKNDIVNNCDGACYADEQGSYKA